MYITCIHAAVSRNLGPVLGCPCNQRPTPLGPYWGPTPLGPYWGPTPLGPDWGP